MRLNFPRIMEIRRVKGGNLPGLVPIDGSATCEIVGMGEEEVGGGGDVEQNEEGGGESEGGGQEEEAGLERVGMEGRFAAAREESVEEVERGSSHLLRLEGAAVN